ncbi:hypothetical protein AWM70_08660 [Paenibacillus yonginensis]|uniref:Uncharacterized protein n=1 Tax=Paenibacillus yonginensis TaxID=1462996 RepID=A0A1B1MZQ6_9BACL|nr:hypothetical protein [Paenibacillus yonginensis]ANS74648.1 hypothetical protein AWM70_08660 [Paenibacillus yonginensis]
MTLFAAMKQDKVFYSIFSVIYTLVMLIAYSRYVWIDHHRMEMSTYWLQKSSLSPADLVIIKHYGNLSTNLEKLFLVALLTALLILLIRYRQNKAAGLWLFSLANLPFYLAVITTSLILPHTTRLAPGNLQQPLFLTVPYISLALVWSGWIQLRRRKVG